MGDKISFDGLTLAGVANDEDGEVGADTVFHFEQTGERIYANYSGGDIADGHVVPLGEPRDTIRIPSLTTHFGILRSCERSPSSPVPHDRYAERGSYRITARI